MRRFTRTAAAVVVAVTTAVAAGCGGGGQGEGAVELRYTWWGDEVRAELMNEALALFQKEHPNITVNASFADYEAYWQRTATEVAGGNAPDVLQMDYTYLREYGERGVLLDLKPHVGQRLAVDNLLAGVKDAGMLEGKRYAVPIGVNMMSFEYDPKVWRSAGLPEPGGDDWTWQAYIDAALQISEHTGQDPYGTAAPGEHLTMFQIWVRQNGQQLYTADGQLGFQPQLLTEYWRMCEEIRDSGAGTPMKIVVESDEATPLGRNVAASEFGWDNFLYGNIEASGKDLQLAPFPTNTGETGLYFKPSMLLSASADTEHPEEAATLIDFLINDPEVGKIFGANRGLPASNAQRDALELSGADKLIEEYESSMADTAGETPPPPPTGGAALERLFLQINEEIAFGQSTVEEGVQRFFDEARNELAS